MRRLGVPTISLVVVMSGCSGSQPLAPTAPSPVSAPDPHASVDRVPAATPVQLPAGTPIAIGRSITSRVNPDDPMCAPPWPYRCRYFEFTPPSDGIIEVTMTWSSQVATSYPLDIDIIDAKRTNWPVSVGPGPQRRLRGRVDAGATYLIEIWSFLTPGEEFELISSFTSM